MGSPVIANLAYGYDIGNIDESPIFEATWFDDVDPDTEPVDQLYAALYAAIPDALPESNVDRRKDAAVEHFGVEIAYCGTDDYSGWVLIAVGSDREACNADTMALDVRELLEGPDLWDGKLAAALTALGVTPTQDWPKWLVFPSYG
jgi:hypothetical protein